MNKKEFKRRLSRYGGALTTKLKQSLKKRKNIAFGGLINSIESKVEDYGSTISLVVKMNKYGWFINKNYHPSKMPPVDLILAWMDRKGIKIDRSKSKYKLRTRKQVAYLIARAISRVGFDTYNKHQIGWFDLVIEQEMIRLRNKASEDLYNALREMTINTLGLDGGQEFERY